LRRTLRRTAAPVGRYLLAAAVIALALVCAQAAAAKQTGEFSNAPATPDNLSGSQWALAQINADQAHDITGGSSVVRVALIDSGIDPGHPEFADRIDRADSVNCVSGTPVTDPSGALWTDDVAHGTQVAGVVAAGDNGFGIVGVAPNVQLVIVKIVGRGQPITPAAVACAFNWVADHNIDVANASFAVDKGATAGGDLLDYFCPTDPADQAAISLVSAAVNNARKSGATIVASAGNNGVDMANPPMGDGCIRMPVGLPGVIGVSGDGRSGDLTHSTPPGASNFGLGVVDLVAPGGDPAQGGVPGGLILTTFPSYIPVPPTSPNIVDGPSGATYRYTAGTSFASAHVTGVAALIVSRFGDLKSPKNGKLPPSWVRETLEKTAESKPCPDDLRCVGDADYNGFFGYGEVDALAALTR
jgi:subtilisin family serine protease